MARASAEDFLQNFRFHVTAELAAPGTPPDPLKYEASGDRGVAGFQSVTMPSYSVNASEYRDGISVFTHKQPGIPSAEDITLMRGVVRKDTTLLDWMFRYFKGNAFRCDLTIFQWDQTGQPPDRSGRWDKGSGGFDPSRARLVRVFNAFPVSVKPGGDMEATADDISVAEVGIAYERFEITGTDGTADIGDQPPQRQFTRG